MTPAPPVPADHLPPPLRAALLAEIDPGETLRWCGQPSPRHVFRRESLPAAGVALAFILLATLAFVAARSIYLELRGVEPAIPWSNQGQRPPYGAVWGAVALGGLFLLGALYGAASPWLEAAKARRTIYALTATRILVLITGPRRTRIEALEPGHPLHLRRTSHPDGRGEIVLYPATQRSPRHQGLIRLIGVDDAREVERLIRATFDPVK